MLDFPEDMQEAIAHLKSTLPVLSKLGLPPNPLNYSLWYVHHSGRRPDLSSIINKISDGSEPLEQELLTKLFESHICLRNGDVIAQSSARFHLMATSLQEQLQGSIDGSSQLDKSLRGARQEVQAAVDSSGLVSSVQTIVSTLDTFGVANREFRRTLQDADAEIDRLRLELEQLQHNANIDELTRLYNRATFYREIKRKIEQGEGKDFCVVLCDLDHFKTINDRFGHLMGDRVLQRIGALLLEKCREGTLAARYGGEEFALIVDAAKLGDAERLAERLRSAIHSLRIKIRNSETVLERLTASFGVACYREGDTAETFFDRADRALYMAKQAGRNVTKTEAALTE